MSFKDIFKKEHGAFMEIRSEYSRLHDENAEIQSEMDKVRADRFLSPEGQAAKLEPLNKSFWDNVHARERVEMKLEKAIEDYRAELENETPIPVITDDNKHLPELISSGVLTDSELLRLGERFSNDIFAARILSREMLSRAKKPGGSADTFKLKRLGAYLDYKSKQTDALRTYDELTRVQLRTVRTKEDRAVSDTLFNKAYPECLQIAFNKLEESEKLHGSTYSEAMKSEKLQNAEYWLSQDDEAGEMV